MSYRSPIIVWLLFAATVCADLVAYSWMRASSPLSYGVTVYFALLVGQLSVVCIWAALRSKVSLWTRIAPVAAVIACSLAFDLIAPATGAKDILPFFGFHAALLLVALWVVRRSAYWRQRTGVETDWQFSVAQLLVLMTVAALLATALRHSVLFEEGSLLEPISLGGSVALAVASVFIWSRASHWLLRLAGVLAVAIGLGAAFYLAGYYMMEFSTIHYLVEGVVLAVWLAWGQILPINESTVVAES